MANPFRSRVRTPIRRAEAQNYLLLTILSFALSVALTRLFLELTGYPQLGRGELHVGHVLWGGLLLFIAAILPLILLNRWAKAVAAILAGVGVGLFIDEVGKFITATNDYFHPAAAPIVYGFFMLIVLLYVQVRSKSPRDVRSEMYWALDTFGEVLDRDLDPGERQDLEAHLSRIQAGTDSPEIRRLATDLLEFLRSDTLDLAPEDPDIFERIAAGWGEIEASWLTLPRLKAVLIGGLLALGLFSLYQFIGLVWSSQTQAGLESLLMGLLESGRVSSASGFFWFVLRISLEAIVGITLLVAAILLLLGRDRGGTALGIVGLLGSLIMVNLFVFYFEQFSSIFPALVEFLLLLGLYDYRRRMSKPAG